MDWDESLHGENKSCSWAESSQLHDFMQRKFNACLTLFKLLAIHDYPKSDEILTWSVFLLLYIILFMLFLLLYSYCLRFCHGGDQQMILWLMHKVSGVNPGYLTSGKAERVWRRTAWKTGKGCRTVLPYALASSETSWAGADAFVFISF